MERMYDVAFVNGRVFTADSARPCAEGFAVRGGRVARVGGAELAAQAKEVVDLKGRRVIPGFVDGHMHPIMQAGVAKQIACLPPAVNSIEELAAVVAKAAAKAEPGQWVEGWGYDEGKLAERRAPNRHDLDRASPEVPVSIVRTCGHIRVVNSRALALAGIGKDTPDPPGGEIERDESGEPTGILKENARQLLDGVYPAASREKKVADLGDLGAALLSRGITTVADMGNLDDTEAAACYLDARPAGFVQRVAIYPMWPGVNPAAPMPAAPADERLRLAGVKLVGDGSVSGRTAWCDQPYLDSEDCGMPVDSEDMLRQAMAYCKANRCQMAVHAMGARAIDRALDVLGQEAPWTEPGVPHARIEHAAMPTPQAILRAAEAGIAFVTQPVFLYAEIESYLRNLGPQRTREAYPIPAMLKAGVPLGISTDAPATAWPTPYDPFVNLKAAVTRTAYDGTDCGAGNRVDIGTALRLYTAESAPLLGFCDVGRLAEGYRADFAVLDRDILEIPTGELDQALVLKTYMDGVCVFSR